VALPEGVQVSAYSLDIGSPTPPATKFRPGCMNFVDLCRHKCVSHSLCKCRAGRRNRHTQHRSGRKMERTKIRRINGHENEYTPVIYPVPAEHEQGE
jgi:hypothetical protein